MVRSTSRHIHELARVAVTETSAVSRRRVAPRIAKRKIFGTLASLEWIGKHSLVVRTHILVVDDDPDLRSALREHLTRRGYRVETAENGYDALGKLDRMEFDGILLDYFMPGVPGLAVLQYIRHHRPPLPVMMMTGQIGNRVAAHAYAGGARACLSKPINQEKLEQVVQCWFGTAA